MIDLHVHSTFSDGTLTPHELLDLASKSGLSCISITDHDTISGLHHGIRASLRSKVRFITGLEISVNEPRAHILGYGIDPTDTHLQRTLTRVAESRLDRNPKIVQRLQSLGYCISMEDVESQSEGEIIGRPHIAKALVEKGYFQTVAEVFDKLIGTGRPAYVDRVRLTAKEGISLIRDAGGVAVLAHPGLLSDDTGEIVRTVDVLRGCGLQGIEAIYTEHSEELSRFLVELSSERGLIWTGGTDFHGENKPDISLGTGRGNLVIPDEVADRLLSVTDRS